MWWLLSCDMIFILCRMWPESTHCLCLQMSNYWCAWMAHFCHNYSLIFDMHGGLMDMTTNLFQHYWYLYYIRASLRCQVIIRSLKFISFLQSLFCSKMIVAYSILEYLTVNVNVCQCFVASMYLHREERGKLAKFFSFCSPRDHILHL